MADFTCAAISHLNINEPPKHRPKTSQSEPLKPISEQETKPSETLEPRAPGGRRLLCAIDGSESSQAAFKFALEKMVVSQRGDDIILFEAAKPVSPDLIFVNDLERQLVQHQQQKRCQKRLEALRELAKVAHVPCQAVVVVGDPREEILKFVAKNPDVDLVVVGTRGIGAVARLFIGSVSSHLVRHSTVPVLVVPRPSQAQPPKT